MHMARLKRVRSARGRGRRLPTALAAEHAVEAAALRVVDEHGGARADAAQRGLVARADRQPQQRVALLLATGGAQVRVSGTT